MKKQLLNKFVAGAIILAPLGTFVSCTQDLGTLDERVTVLEGMIRNLEEKLNASIVTGATITNASQAADGTWTLTLSDESVITIAPSASGGSDVTVEETAEAFKITVNGTEYVLPKGAAVSSLVFVDEYGDGTVVVKSEGAEVRLLASPKLAASDIAAAEFTFADVREVKTRAGEGLFEVTTVELDGDVILVKFIGTGCDAGKTYVASVQLKAKGSTICSNYFKLAVANDFSFAQENLEDPKIKTDVITDFEAKGEGFWTATMPDPLGAFNFKDYYSELPTGEIEFELAPSAMQNPAVQGRYDVFKEALAKDGSWEFKQRPATSGWDETNNGVLIYMKADKQIKNKVWWKIHDPLGGLDFQALNGLSGNFEAELYGRDGGYVEAGTTIDIPKTLNEWETLIPIRHSGDAWFQAWNNYSIKDGENEVIYNNGTTLVVHDDYKKYLKHSRGIEWFWRGFAVYVPENLATEEGKYIDKNGKPWSGAEGYGYDSWGPGSAGEWFAHESWYESNGAGGKPNWASFPIKLDAKTGVLTFEQGYTGYGVRIAFSAAFQYAFGEKILVGAGTDQLGMLFFNRRVAPEGATMPEPYE